MLRSRKQKQRQCYFCLTPDEATNGRASPASPASRPRDWRCTACGCWNLHDRYGVITGDTPAMRDPTLNSASFAKRGEWGYGERRVRYSATHQLADFVDVVFELISPP